MASSPFLLLMILIVVLLTLSTMANSTRISRLDVISWGCNKDNVSDGAAYLRSYQGNLEKIRNHMKKLKFGRHEHGDPPQRMYVLSQCMGDLTLEECGVCWSRAADLLSQCFPATGGRFYLDGCFIRAENYSFYDEAITHYDSKVCSSGNESTAQFGNLVKQVIKDIEYRAPYIQGFAVSQKGDHHHHLTAYGLGICWQTLDEDLCKLCLSDGALSVAGCLPSKEGFALNAGCYLRYSDYAFYSERGSIRSLGATRAFVIYILFIVIVGALALTTGYWCGKCIYVLTSGGKKRREKESRAVCNDSKFMRFKYSTLQKATSNFNETCRLGIGGYGEVFKGTLPDGREIAIKRMHISGNKPQEEIHNEIDVISKCEHKNLVRLLGCCFTNMNSFMVYEFLANTSLNHFLFHPEKKKELDWKKRLAIILGTAEGLEHLHECRIIHRDIKASNILLDLRYKPKISDFGLAQFYPDSNKNIPPSPIAGTLGYMAPEYISDGRLTSKIDVYSFGVLVLEIACGVPNNRFRSDNSLETLVTRVWQCFSSDKVEEMIDKDMDNVDEVKRVIQIGLLCTQESPHLRPWMSKVIQMLKDTGIELPSPTKPPFMDKIV
ncbi:PREDICTED: putative cysteine-rich receptor-like protein kinase 43 isoform X2 [Tarenaya hassleriana]|uniref:putative cysteine-rich receptor-like protein kinase 43 isoform X2 n=1 Tax=Tarenaya hassleriana TaxID=28532 RepID=UPI00053C3011|nr:PREDICTED: putative cysteine-rich receptor-like protein kinase 43 isoform X2 [Tarenaya hassleriana]